MEQGSSALLSITGGDNSPNTYAAWLDRNGDEIFSTDEQLVRASTKGDPIYEAVETLLKGPEISLLEHRQLWRRFRILSTSASERFSW